MLKSVKNYSHNFNLSSYNPWPIYIYISSLTASSLLFSVFGPYGYFFTVIYGLNFIAAISFLISSSDSLLTIIPFDTLFDRISLFRIWAWCYVLAFYSFFPVSFCIILEELKDTIFSLLEYSGNFYRKLTLSYVIKLMLRSLILRTIVHSSIAVLLWWTFVPTSVVYAIVVASLVLYYGYRLVNMLNTMSLFNAVVIIVLTFILISSLWLAIFFIFAFIPNISIFSFDVVFMSENGSSSSNSDSDSSSSDNGSSSEGPGNDIEPNDLPDAGPMAECEHTGHWFVYPDLNDPDIRCDFGGTPGADGRIMPTHSAYCPSGDPMLCNLCSAIGCHDCVNLPDDSSDNEVQAGPSVQSGSGVAPASNESTENTDVSQQDPSISPHSNDNQHGNNKG